MFIDTVKEIWKVVRFTYSMKKNASRVFEVYEDLCSLQQGDKSLEEYYNHLKDMIDELNQYHPVINDIKVLKKQREELYVCKFLPGLSSQLKPLQGQLLAGEEDSLSLSLQNTFSWLSQPSESFTVTSNPSPVEGSVLFFLNWSR